MTVKLVLLHLQPAISTWEDAYSIVQLSFARKNSGRFLLRIEDTDRDVSFLVQLSHSSTRSNE